MKKYSIYLCLALLIGLFSSCSQDNNDALPADAGNLVSFTATLPADWAPATTTRAVPGPPANHQLRCILEIWTKDLSALKVRKELLATGTDNLTFTFELGEMGDYKALLWTDYIDEGANTTTTTIAGLADVAHYPDKYYRTDDVSGLQAVQLKAGVEIPGELRDGFFGATDFTKNALPLKGLSVTLTRPFSKFILSERNIDKINSCESVEVTYTVPKQFNVANGTHEGEFKNTKVRLTPDRSVIYYPLTDEDGYIIFSDYIFADTEGTMGEIVLDYFASQASGLVFKPFTLRSGLPIKRNEISKFIGSIMDLELDPSPSVEMEVVIDNNWWE